jgi:hypothetical protein
MRSVKSLISVPTCCLLFFAVTCFGSEQPYITSDISRFWEAFDKLKSAETTKDSINLIQKFYIDRLTIEGKRFVKLRNYAADEYVRVIRKYPKYLKQLRLKTDNILTYQAMLDSGFIKLKAAIPQYKTPRLCFAIGCFRGGGTGENDLILMGAEIALADPSMDFTEFNGNLRDILSKGVNLKELVAHESVHCQQYKKKSNNLLAIALREGTANFLSTFILNNGQLPNLDKYGLEHECELWKEFKLNIHSEDTSQWFYNTGSIKNKPADLGYFMGMRICEAYYNKQPDKTKAIKVLLDRSKYEEVMEQSDYSGSCEKY